MANQKDQQPKNSEDAALLESLQAAQAGDIVWTTDSKQPAKVAEPVKTGVIDMEQHRRDKAAVEAPVVEEIRSDGMELERRNNSRRVRIDAEKIENYLDLIGELVVIKSQIMQDPTLQNAKDQRLTGLLLLLDKTVRELQDASVSMRMTSLRTVFSRLRRIVGEVCTRLHKNVELTVIGEDTELDRGIVELVGDPLMHLCRNAIDHGIESPEVRRAAGKPERGRLVIEAGHQGGRIFIEIRDDGRGIDYEKVFEHAKTAGLVPEGRTMEDYSTEALVEFLFLPGFSTVDTATDISGRGVGLDVVKGMIEQVKGRVAVETRPGEGTAFRMWIPLTTAITDGMLLRVGQNTYVLPIEVIRELIQVKEGDISEGDDGRLVVNNRGTLLPLLDLNNVLNTRQGREGEDEITMERLAGAVIVIAEARSQQVALLVDQVLGQNQVVVKGLGSAMPESSGVAGAAILGDGRVGLILDVADLVDFWHVNPSDLREVA